MNKKFLYILTFALALAILFPSCFLEDLFDVYSEGEAPNITDTKISRDFNQVWAIELWWDSLDGRDAYELERSEDGYTYKEIAGWTSNAYFVDRGDDLSPQGLKPGSTYEYRARGHFEDWVKVDGGYGPWGGLVAVIIPNFVRPENLTVTLSPDGNSVFLNWNDVDVANYYEIHHRDDPLIPYSEIGSATDSEFVDTSSDFSPGTTHDYKVRALSLNYGDTDFSETVSLDTTVVVTASWQNLGSSGFGTAEGEIELASMGGNLYALFADAADVNKRIKVMKHDENDSGSWSDAGTYLSLAAAGSNEVSALVSGSTLYAAYADTDASIGSGGSPRISVKQYNGSAWLAVGAAEGVSTFDTTALGAFGAEAALTTDGSGLFLVYQTDSFLAVNSLSYSGTGAYWIEENSDYWTIDFPPISAFEIGLFTESGGQQVAALQSGGGGNPVVNMYRFSGGAWTSYGTEFLIGTEDGQMNLLGFTTDISDTPYLAVEKWGTASEPVVSEVTKWNGSAWQNIGLASQLTDLKKIFDIAIVENAGGNGILVAAAYQDNSDAYKVELWEYTGSWTQIGSALDSIDAALSVDVAIDSISRPVLLFTVGTNRDIRAVIFRE